MLRPIEVDQALDGRDLGPALAAGEENGGRGQTDGP
jgi:hypothetical protein